MRELNKFGLFALFSPAAFAQSQPNVADILKKVSETYKSASQYEFITDMTVPGAQANAGTSGHVLFAFKSPDRYRMEGAFPGVAEFGEALIVDDGSAVWFYVPKTNQYASFPASQVTSDAAGDLGDLRPEAMAYSMTRFLEVLDMAKGAKVLREESITIAGVKSECFVIAASQSLNDASDSFTLWVDKKTYHVLREDSGDASMVFTTVKLGESLPDDLFKFVPPAGANEVETHVEPRRIPPPPPPAPK
jgi:outer membrane lipoprotein-sorting protein